MHSNEKIGRIYFVVIQVLLMQNSISELFNTREFGLVLLIVLARNSIGCTPSFLGSFGMTKKSSQHSVAVCITIRFMVAPMRIVNCFD